MSILLNPQLWIIVQSVCDKSFDPSSQDNLQPKQEIHMFAGLNMFL